MKVADRTDDEWTQLHRTFFANNHGASGSTKQLTDLLTLAGVTPPEGTKYRDLQKLFLAVRDEVEARGSAILNRKISEGFLKAFIETGGR